MCFGDFFPMRTLCDAYDKEFESHQCSILDVHSCYMFYSYYVLYHFQSKDLSDSIFNIKHRDIFDHLPPLSAPQVIIYTV